MKARYVLTEHARDALATIGEHIAMESGLGRAELVVRRIERAFQLLADNPHAGHVREDLADDPALKFWSVYSYLIAYVSTTRPLTIVSILHGARDPEAIREHLRRARDDEV